MRRLSSALVAFAAIAVLATLLIGVAPARAAAGPLTISPLGWNVVGLDSNNTSQGPNQFPIGAKVCNTGDDPVDDLDVTWDWTSSDAYINFSDSTAASKTVSLASLPGSACKQFYFTIEITRDSAAYDNVRNFTITAEGSNASAVTTPANRQIYVEKLVSQNRNVINSLTGLPANGIVGATYTVVLNGATATGGYEQLSAYSTLDSSIFEIQSVQATYVKPVAGSTNTQFYADGCGWDPVVGSADYRSCVGPPTYPLLYPGTDGKVGGNSVIVTMVVKVIAPGTTTIGSVLYDFSGSSYHYNSDYADFDYTFTATQSSVTAVDDTTSTKVDIAKTINVLGNDSTNGGTLDPSSVSVTVAPSCAPDGTTTVNADGSITFTPINGFTGTCTFTYEVCNTFGSCDTAVVTVVINDQAPGMTIVKTITSTAPGAIGDVITYSIVVTNTGGDDLTNLVVSDPNATLTPDPCSSALLVRGATLTCSASHTVTAEDMDRGQFTNTASAVSDQTTASAQTDEYSMSVRSPLAQTPAFTVTKTQTSNDPAALGDAITYSIVVTNTGNVQLDLVLATDGNAELDPNPCNLETLAVGASMTCSATHIVTIEDMIAGQVINTAVGYASFGGLPLDNVDSQTITTLVPLAAPALTVVKTQTSVDPTVVGDPINYSIVATNSGNVPLDAVSITDDNATIDSCTPLTPAALAATESVTCSATHTVTVEDFAAGSVVNTAVAAASFNGQPIADSVSNEVLTQLPNPTPPTTAPAGSGDLPFTGSDAGLIVGMALLVLGAGALLALLARHRRMAR